MLANSDGMTAEKIARIAAQREPWTQGVTGTLKALTSDGQIMRNPKFRAYTLTYKGRQELARLTGDGVVQSAQSTTRAAVTLTTSSDSRPLVLRAGSLDHLACMSRRGDKLVHHTGDYIGLSPKGLIYSGSIE